MGYRSGPIYFSKSWSTPLQFIKNMNIKIPFQSWEKELWIWFLSLFELHGAQRTRPYQVLKEKVCPGSMDLPPYIIQSHGANPSSKFPKRWSLIPPSWRPSRRIFMDLSSIHYLELMKHTPSDSWVLKEMKTETSFQPLENYGSNTLHF